MAINEIAQLISTVGFPIACCCVMFYQNNKLQETLHEVSLAMQKLTTQVEDICENQSLNINRKDGN